MGFKEFPDSIDDGSEKKGEFNFEEIKSVGGEMNSVIEAKRMHPSQPIWWGNRLCLGGADQNAGISSEWNETDRANALAKIGQEMVQHGNASNKVAISTLVEWLERIQFVLARPAEFLEANRKNIIEFKK